MENKFSQSTIQSNIINKDQKYIWHPFTQMLNEQLAIPIVKAHGCYLYSEDGRQYLDAISSWWVNLHGHCHPFIAEAIKHQVDILDHVIFAGFTHKPAVDLAEKLLSILPRALKKIFYSDNGSTAVEAAIKMAIQFFYNRDSNTPRTKIVCLKHSYHGDTFGAMSAAGKNKYNKPFWKHLFQIETIDFPSESQVEHTLSQMKSIFEKGDVACFIFEPLILGAGGMLIYSAAALDSLLDLCKEYNVITIADEVMTGFGRTGTLFACERLRNSPDIICLSKGLTGGFLSLAVTACSDEIFNAFLSDNLQDAFLHGHSYSGNPIACSTALASLELLLNEECMDKINFITQSHLEFVDVFKGNSLLKRCESLGTILVFEYTEKYSPKKLCNYFLSQGIVVRPLGHVFYVMPPYCINEKQLNFIYSTIKNTLEVGFESR